MASGFNMARAEVYAKREGISISEACSRISRAGWRRRKEKARQNACVPVAPASAQATARQNPPGFWWQREALS